MSIAKTTRPHLLTREAAAARIEALEAQIAADTIRLTEDADVMEEATMRVTAQRARIEALEAALLGLRGPLAELVIGAGQMSHPLTTCISEIGFLQERVREKNARIEALEAALRACVQYHVKAAADNRAIAAVNQNNDLGENSLNHAVDHEIAAEDIGEIARAALTPEQE